MRMNSIVRLRSSGVIGGGSSMVVWAAGGWSLPHPANMIESRTLFGGGMKNIEATRRRFLAHFSSMGLGATLLPGVLWAGMQENGVQQITQDMLKTALKTSGLSFTDEDEKAMLTSANQALTKYDTIRKIKIPNDVSP